MATDLPVMDALPDILKDGGYPDVQVFMENYRKSEVVVDQYNRDLAKWERQVKIVLYSFAKV